jgi:hypothetical protein
MNHPPRHEAGEAQNVYTNYMFSLTGGLLFTPPACATYLGSEYSAYDEWLQDVSGPRRPGMHPCYHYKRAVKYIGGMPTFKAISFVNGYDYANGVFLNTEPITPQVLIDSWSGLNVPAGIPNPVAAYGYSHTPFNGLPTIGTLSTSSNVYNVGPRAFPELEDRAMRALLPGIRAANGVSLLNSIYELKDVKTVRRTVNSVFNFFNKKWTPSWRHPFRLLRLAEGQKEKPLRQLLRMGSDGWLQTQFNILPLLSDIVGIRTALSDARKELHKLISNASQPQRKHFTCELPGYNDSNVIVNYNSKVAKPSPGCSYGRAVRYNVKKFNLVLEYSYTLPPWVTQDSLLPALLDRLGVNINPAIIWNAIPWSFVVDWVFGVNRWLDYYKHKNIEPHVVIRDACASVKIVREIHTWANLYGYGQGTCILTESSYNRENRIDMGNLLLRSGLNLKEFSLLAALWGSR